MTFRIGHGIDFHRLAEGRKLMLGGVAVPHEKGLLGHSDADVLLHAICDALLGACGKGDIGRHFPDSDPQFKGISSLLLLEETGRLIAPYQIMNIDATIIAQAPKLAPYLSGMEVRIAQALHLAAEKVNVKATTSEGMGYCGAGEGMEAHAVCLVSLPDDSIQEINR